MVWVSWGQTRSFPGASQHRQRAKGSSGTQNGARRHFGLQDGAVGWARGEEQGGAKGSCRAAGWRWGAAGCCTGWIWCGCFWGW